MNVRSMSYGVVIAALVFSTLACQLGTLPSLGGVRGSGDVIEESREVSGISGVELGTLGELTIEISDEESFRIEAEDNLLEYLETDVRGGTLTIENRSGANLMPTRPVRYYLTVRQLDEIALSSSGDVVAPDLAAERFSVQVSSSGDLEMGDLSADVVTVDMSSSGSVSMDRLNADRLNVSISSSGSVEIADGTVDRQDITISSSGSYRARQLQSREAEVRISSSGDATIRVSDQLTARLSSSGNLEYIGTPDVDASETSSGDVRQIGD